MLLYNYNLEIKKNINTNWLRVNKECAEQGREPLYLLPEMKDQKRLAEINLNTILYNYQLQNK